MMNLYDFCTLVVSLLCFWSRNDNSGVDIAFIIWNGTGMAAIELQWYLSLVTLKVPDLLICHVLQSC